MRPTVLREAPTHKPRFGNPAEAGEGYPFDMFMYSTLPVGMPLLVVHTSADGAWVFVETGLVSGWVPTEDTAVTDAPFRSRYENGTYAVIVRDDVPLVDELGRYVTTGSLGTMLPLSGGSGSSLRLLVPVRDPQGRAVAVPVRVSSSDAVRKPIPLTARGGGRDRQPHDGAALRLGRIPVQPGLLAGDEGSFRPFWGVAATQLIGAGQGMAVHQLREGVPLG